jgi:hypothetical protein
LTTSACSATTPAWRRRAPPAAPHTHIRNSHSKEAAVFRTAAISTFILLASTALPARADAKGDAKADVEAAAKKLADAPSYAWTQKTEGGFGGGTAEGKAEKDGFTFVSMTLFNNDVEIVKKGDKGAVKLEDGWKSVEELAAETPQDGQPNRGRFVAMMMRNYRAPAAVATDLVTKVKELKKTDDAFEAELTEEGAKSLLSFRGRPGGQDQAPQISNAKGTAKFWVKDGALTKFEHHLTGSINFNGQDRDIDRTTTVELKDVGTAKVEVPEEAKKKAS